MVEVPGATIRATCSQETYLLERVKARLGSTTTTDISDSEHGDWSGDDYLSDVAVFEARHPEAGKCDCARPDRYQNHHV